MNAYLYLILLALAAGYAWRRGGAPERLVASLIVAAVVASAIALGFSTRVFGSKEVGLFVVDLVLCVAVVLVALHAERFWPLWLSALLILSVLLQLAIWYAPYYYRAIYLILHALSAYPTLMLLAAGTARHRRRLMQHGLDPAWSGEVRQRPDPAVRARR
ncbi:hypothetical protein [Sphingomonas sp. VNH70]|uniref:hypothetical protein n=1 Tax=Sphingomonas silueang TaxID=3156617 RepID=UPI0032B4AC4A